jgi:hypothetical protein
MGHYDAVAVIEAPDDESITAMMLELTAEGGAVAEVHIHRSGHAGHRLAQGQRRHLLGALSDL